MSIMNTWQQDLRLSLKGAKQCNEFFQTNVFLDQSFAIKVPINFANLIDNNNPNDPLFKQILPQAYNSKTDFLDDPLADDKHSPVEGLIHKYPNRVLLIASQVCAIHCQYCFRQNFNYTQHDAISNWPAIENYINNNTQINEVILSGGDPLSLSDEKLEKLVKNIENFTNVHTLRIHSRSIVVVPSRITDKLTKLLAKTHLKVVLVTHINHEREISKDFIKNIGNFTNVTLLNQSVLLKGVNDAIESLEMLSLKLFDVGILPYYLHMLDKVKGSESFYLEDEVATTLHQQLQKRLSGYLVPKLVRDTGGDSKQWLL